MICSSEHYIISQRFAQFFRPHSHIYLSLVVDVWIFLSKYSSTYVDAHIYTCTHSPPRIHEHIRKTELTYLNIEEVTSDTSLSTGTSPSYTERIATVKFWNKSRKMRALVQSRGRITPNVLPVDCINLCCKNQIVSLGDIAKTQKTLDPPKLPRVIIVTPPSLSHITSSFQKIQFYLFQIN